jgi:hypothetical protein
LKNTFEITTEAEINLRTATSLKFGPIRFSLFDAPKRNFADTCHMNLDKLKMVWPFIAGILMGFMTYALLERLIQQLAEQFAAVKWESTPAPLAELPWLFVLALIAAQGIAALFCAAIATFSSNIVNQFVAIVAVVCLMCLSAFGLMYDHLSLWIYLPGLLLAWPATIWGHKLGLLMKHLDRL